ncbi:MAG: hypothetical protein IVW55_13740, partial [Chloroflexi bacterium]|nr:hypothetical protein [Chloroflexota bacterium]
MGKASFLKVLRASYLASLLLGTLLLGSGGILRPLAAGASNLAQAQGHVD